MSVIAPIGFMQGRLSPLIDGRIQAFPWNCWQREFPVAQQHGFHLMEWTLDQARLYENPLLTSEGRQEILALCQRHEMAIPSLTGDCFMHAPFWKAEGIERENLQRDFCAVAEACAAVGISTIVVPLVDSGRLEDEWQTEILVAFFEGQTKFLSQNSVRVAFESDFAPTQLARLAERFDSRVCGINYDIGNSAALGFDPADEIAAYGNRIVNVHIKDRVLGGATVPLGSGNADFTKVFSALARAGYTGNYILQTARANDGNHAGVISRYRDLVTKWLAIHAT